MYHHESTFTLRLFDTGQEKTSINGRKSNYAEYAEAEYKQIN